MSSITNVPPTYVRGHEYVLDDSLKSVATEAGFTADGHLLPRHLVEQFVDMRLRWFRANLHANEGAIVVSQFGLGGVGPWQVLSNPLITGGIAAREDCLSDKATLLLQI